MSACAATTRTWKHQALRALWQPALLALLSAGAAHAQSFSAAPVVFPPTGDNAQSPQQVNITLTAPSTIRSITIPLPLAATPEFTLVDNGGCVEDGTTLNPAGSVCSLVVRFHPALAGVRTASLVITDGSGTATAIGLSGVGFYPQIAITPGTARIVAGLGPSYAGYTGDGGPASGAELAGPQAVAADSFGNVFLIDNSVVRMLDAFGNITTVAGGGSAVGAAANGGQATLAKFTQISNLACDSAGNLYISDSANNVVWRVAMSTTHILSAVAGNFTQGYSGDGGAATSAQMHTPLGIVLDGAGNLYIADEQNQRIRLVDASGTISTFAGNGSFGTGTTPTHAADASFAFPMGLALDSAGNLYVSEPSGHYVREISGGMVLPLAGTGATGNSGDGGAALSATFNYPAGLAVSPAGDVYIADAGSDVVRKVQASDGTIETVAGDPAQAGGFTSSSMPAPSIAMNSPVGLAFDSRMNLYIVDSGNNVVRELSSVPGEIGFATIAVGSTSAPQALKIANIGNAPLSLGSVAAADTATASNFTLSNGAVDACGSTVAAGAHCQYSVSFNPQSGSSGTGEIDITHVSNNPNFNTVEPVYLLGGTLYPITITPTTAPGATVSQVYKATISIAGGYGTLRIETSSTMPPGVTATINASSVTLMGTPTTAGTYTFTLYADDVIGDSAQQTITLVVSPVVLALAVSEAIHITDTPTETPSLTLAVMEAIHVTDTPKEALSLTLAVREAIQVTDTLTETPSLTLAVMEAIHVSDTPKEVLSLTLAVSEAIHVTDTPTEVPSLTLAVAESIHVTDAPAEALSLTLAITEAIHILDAPATGGQQSQTLTVATVPNYTYGDPDFTPSASASSGLPVSVAVVSGPASIIGTSVDMNGAGTVVLTFTQAGNANTAAATPVQRTFVVAPAPATITATNASRAFETPNPALTFTIAGLVRGDTVASLSGTPALTTTSDLNSPAGTYPISAAQGTLSSANYTFSFVNGTLTITGHTAQTITFNKIPNVPLAVGTLTLTAHSTSALPVTYVVTGPATLRNGSKLTLNAAGTVTVTASQAGNSTFDAAASVTRSFTVTP